jgi:hypothetical protein
MGRRSTPTFLTDTQFTPECSVKGTASDTSIVIKVPDALMNLRKDKYDVSIVRRRTDSGKILVRAAEENQRPPSSLVAPPPARAKTIMSWMMMGNNNNNNNNNNKAKDERDPLLPNTPTTSGKYYFLRDPENHVGGTTEAVRDSDGGQVHETLPEGSTEDEFAPRVLGAAVRTLKIMCQPKRLHVAVEGCIVCTRRESYKKLTWRCRACYCLSFIWYFHIVRIVLLLLAQPLPNHNSTRVV